MPKADRRIPILIAANRPRMLRLTARYADAWNTAWFWEPNQKLHDRLAAFDEALTLEGRAPTSVRRTVGIEVPEADKRSAATAWARRSGQARGSGRELHAHVSRNGHNRSGGWSGVDELRVRESSGRGRRRMNVLAAIILALASTACGGGTSNLPAQTPTPVAKLGQIAFARGTQGNQHIFVVNPDGSGLTQLTTGKQTDGEPAWSPDGKQIVFYSDRTAGFQLYVMNADGTGVKRLTKDSGSDGFADWSRDGTKIAFASLRNGTAQIYVMNSDGTNMKRLTNTKDSDFSPHWSKDDSKIAFDQDIGGANFDIFVMNSDGSGVIQITHDPLQEEFPIWSPDGTKIAFFSDRDGQVHVYVMNPDGTDAARVSRDSATEALPTWSPDGAKIAFVSDRSGPGSIYVMSADGTGLTRITNAAEEDRDPAWSPVTSP